MLGLEYIYTVPCITDTLFPGIPKLVLARNGGTLIASLAAKVLENQNYVVNIKHRGAIGGGLVDNAAAIQAVINELGDAGGGQIFVPKDTFLVSTPLILRSNVYITGIGTIKSTANSVVISGQDVTNIAITGITIEGDADVADNLQRGIQFINVTNSIVEDCSVKNVGYDGILLLSGCVNNVIGFNRISGCKDDGINIGGDAINPSCTDNTVVGNTVTGGTDDGIHVSDKSLRTVVSANVITGCLNGISLFKTNYVTLVGNQISGCTYGIHTPAGPNSNITIQGNSIENCLRGVNLANVSTSKATINANIISLCTEYGIVLSETPSAYVDAIVTANQISSVPIGVYLSGVKNVTVANNNIMTTTGDGIYIKSAAGFECTYINILNNQLRSIGDEGIEVEAGTLSQHITLKGNSFKDITGRCIEYRGGAYFSVCDNRCYDSSDFTILISGNALGAGYGIVERNTIVGGATTEAIRVNNYNDVLVKDNTITGIAGNIAINCLVGFRIIVDSNNTDKSVLGGIQKSCRFTEDFCSVTLDADTWNVQKGSDGTNVNFAILANQIRGTLRGTAGSGNGGTMATSGVQISSPLNWRANQNGLYAEFRVACFSATNEALFFGFTDQNAALEMPFTLTGAALTSNASNACGVLYDTSATLANWKLVGVANDVDAVVQDSGVAPVAGTFELWRIEIGSTGSAMFYRNGAPVGAIMVGAVNNATALCLVVAGFSRTNATKNFDVDLVDAAQNRV